MNATSTRTQSTAHSTQSIYNSPGYLHAITAVFASWPSLADREAEKAGSIFDHLHLMSYGTPEQISAYFRDEHWRDWHESEEEALRELAELHTHPFYRDTIGTDGWDGEWSELAEVLGFWPLSAEIWAFENRQRILSAGDEEKRAMLRAFASEEDQFYLFAHCGLGPHIEYADFLEDIIPGGWYSTAFLHAFLNGQTDDLRRRCSAMADAWHAFTAQPEGAAA